ncbi:hypothetical protein ECZU17_63160 [Escherichia coli]|nr:hypothetical protein ECZU17_63160 [Escherichia coli]
MRLPPSRPSCLDSFAESVTEAQKLAQPDDFDFLHRIGESYATLRRYAPEFLAVLLRAAPAAKNVLDAIEVLRGMNTDNARKLPADAPTGFIKPRWQKLVMTDAGIDRRYYELCALSELKNSCARATSGCRVHASSRTSRTTGTAREVHQPQAVQRIAAGRGHRLRTISA